MTGRLAGGIVADMGNRPTLDYAAAKPHSRAKKWLKRLALALLILASLYTAPLAWLYWGWKQEQPARQMVARVGGTIGRMEPAGPAFLEHLMPARLGWIRERIAGIALIKTPAIDDDLRTLRPLSRLKGLDLFGTQVTDAGLAHLKGLTGLQRLFLSAPSRMRVTDAGVADLQKALPGCRIYR